MTTDTETRAAQHEALKRLMKPVERPVGPRHDIGDGDPCPTEPKRHGKMLVISSSREPGKKVQLCTHSDHYGRPASNALGELPQSRSIWPLYLEN